MRDLETIVATGHGGWGGESYGFRLSTVESTRWDSAGARCETTRQYAVLMQPPGDRYFSTEAQRDAFLRTSFTDLTVDPMDPPEVRERQHALATLVAVPVSAVLFVMDYLQLQFNSRTLSYNAWPVLDRHGEVLSRADRGYADGLVSLIGVPVAGVDELLDLGLVLTFSDGSRLRVELNQPDRAEPEVDYFDDEPGAAWLVWHPQEPA